MAILVSGDFHNDALGELMFLTRDYLIEQYNRKVFNEIKYHIILGDCGFFWPGSEVKDILNFKALSERPFPILCVFGNHEPVLGRTDLPEIDIGIGEKVILVSEEKPFIAFLKRGKVYHIDNYKFLVLGGALSIDKEYRVPELSWWENEYWTKKEKSDVFALIKKDNSFDYVLSHTGPNNINEKVFLYSPDAHVQKFSDEVAILNEKIDQKIKCRQWFCGHWHEIFYHFDKKRNRGYQYLYKQTALIKENEIISPRNTMPDLSI